ncbi:hypothetical protein Pla52o_51690 [Novipirellula galeiformis]|uniref:Uncharacterized protein n=1 Tax=Novipirellula galeiformis TaxID=2528004 RepID=A0A5C6BZK2_9BACT|nr:hypothetical protein [Novipirellula galeiformis]TWU17365.1 hypothetical protein Pla52o_51690 [Novipirellula galeiformis]
MARNVEKSNVDSKPWVVGFILVVSLGLAGLWWWSHSRVELDEMGYDVTIALYRVCNQRSDDGLQQIENQIRKLETEQAFSSAANQAIMSIIATAKAGQWQKAARACRQALEDQVQR